MSFGSKLGIGLLLFTVRGSGAASPYYTQLIEDRRWVEHNLAVLTQLKSPESSLAKAELAGSQFLATAPPSLIVAAILDLACLTLAAFFIRSQVTRNRRLSESQTRLAAIVDSSQDAIFGKTLDGIITSWNRGAERIYGFKAEEVIGKPISILMPKDRVDEIPHILRKLGQGQNIEHYESLRRTKDGRVRNVAISVSPICDISGQLIGASAIERDITAQKQAESALRKSEEQYRLLFDSSPLPMWVFELKTLKFLAVNEATVRHYGYAREEFLRMTLLDIRSPEEVPALLKATERPATSLGEPQIFHHRTKDGTLIDVEITRHGILFQGKQAELVLAHDVTERRRSEEQLQQSEERFSKAFRSSPLGITISTRLEERYVDVNDAFLRLIGYDREEVIGRTVDELGIWVNPQDRNAMTEQLILFGRVTALETEFKTRSGEVRLTQLSAENIQLHGVPCVLATTNDITEAKRLEQQFRQAQKMEAVGRLAGGVAHDFNNMLGVILGYSEILQEHFHPSDPPRQHVEEIKKAAQRAASLTRQLLAFSRQQVLDPRSLNLNTVIENLSSMLRHMIGEDVELVLALSPDLGTVKADQAQMEQILMNLAVNSRDAMPEGGKLTIQTANSVLHEADARHNPGVRSGAYVMMSVTDTGWGINSEIMPHIFEPFFTTKGPGKGTGLGLSTVYGVVKQTGGYIEVYSEAGTSTAFKIYLPRVDAPVAPSEQTDSQVAPASGRETTLLVEDDEPLRKLTRSVLESSGYRVLEAEDASAAIRIAETYKDPIQLLLTDVVMPGMSGRQLVSTLAPFRPEMHVLYTSGHTDELMVNSFESKAVILEKPFTRSALLGKVREALRNPA